MSIITSDWFSASSLHFHCLPLIRIQFMHALLFWGPFIIQIISLHGSIISKRIPRTMLLIFNSNFNSAQYYFLNYSICHTAIPRALLDLIFAAGIHKLIEMHATDSSFLSFLWLNLLFTLPPHVVVSSAHANGVIRPVGEVGGWLHVSSVTVFVTGSV